MGNKCCTGCGEHENGIDDSFSEEFNRFSKVKFDLVKNSRPSKVIVQEEKKPRLGCEDLSNYDHLKFDLTLNLSYENERRETTLTKISSSTYTELTSGIKKKRKRVRGGIVLQV